MIYMLDTATAAAVIRGGPPGLRRRLVAAPAGTLTVSAVTKGELVAGLASRGRPAGLETRVREFLLRVEVVPWGADAAEVFAEFATKNSRLETPLSRADLMVAAHAAAANASMAAEGGAVLVTRERGFARLVGLKVEDWFKGS